MTRTFDHILLLGRPAAGKSEFIDFMKHTPDAVRSERYHIGSFVELDDFPWLWEKFVEDDLWEEAGYERVFSDRVKGNYGTRPDQGRIYDFMLSKFNQAVAQQYLSKPEFYREGTLIIEFARGGEEGYRNALGRLSKGILERAAIFYVQVSFDESWRRNVARYQEKFKDSSLQHMAPKEVMERFYRIDDWEALTEKRPHGTLHFQGVDVPFVTMYNEPELKEYEALSKRYGPHLDQLWELFQERSSF